jgi:2-C-methyl-D-erythritol 2,4-cyclodiphosphate synthase
MRVGFGYDVHGFDASRTLQLGGVTIEGVPGLAGWSDADVICHAIIDAVLGAAGLGDAGRHFPEDAVPEGASSLELLVQTSKLVSAAGYRVVNVDCTIAIQDVLMGPHSEMMRSRIALALGIETEAVNIGATTTDRLGFVGKGEGAAAMAVALVEEES